MSKPSKPAGPTPGVDSLTDAAMRHLARFAATEAGLIRVLDRAIHRWAARARAELRDVGDDVTAARGAARTVAAALVKAGIVDDAAFAAARSRRLMRAGRSRRATASHLAAKGIRPDLAETVLPAEEDELPAAVTHARRRRIGPFRAEADPESRLRDLAAFARAGFSRAAAERALDLDVDTAEAMVIALRQG